ncbi:MAG: hypothetical protein JWN83_1219 [Chitinophagaceae bacterium]|nr:hypothetical protein [Chitinophagaceae bacterium]
MSERSNAFLLEDILESIKKILEYTSGITKDEFLADYKTQDAVSRNFEIIGEASGRLTNEFKIMYSSINWREVKDFRNTLIHDYFGTNYTTVWLIIHNDLKILQEKLIGINKKLSEEI